MKKALSFIVKCVAAVALVWMLAVEDPGFLDFSIPAVIIMIAVKVLGKLEPFTTSETRA